MSGTASTGASVWPSAPTNTYETSVRMTQSVDVMKSGQHSVIHITTAASRIASARCAGADAAGNIGANVKTRYTTSAITSGTKSIGFSLRCSVARDMCSSIWKMIVLSFQLRAADTDCVSSCRSCPSSSPPLPAPPLRPKTARYSRLMRSHSTSISGTPRTKSDRCTCAITRVRCVKSVRCVNFLRIFVKPTRFSRA